jgi:hypothetical protein
MKRILTLAVALLVAAPVLAQTTTTVKSDNPPPPPPSTTVTTQPQSGSSTTVTTGQPPPPSSSTQVVVNPNESSTTTATTRVRASDESVGIETHHDTRTDIAIVATDALYGGIAGTLVGGGIALINQGNNWGRDLMIGAGIGILVGAGYGVYEATTRENTVVRHAAADRDPGSSSATNLSLVTGRF